MVKISYSSYIIFYYIEIITNYLLLYKKIIILSEFSIKVILMTISKIKLNIDDESDTLKKHQLQSMLFKIMRGLAEDKLLFLMAGLLKLNRVNT